MADPTPHDTETETAPDRLPPTILDRIPLAMRMLFYGAFFLSIVLLALPWLAYRIDVHFPSWHIELGWLRLIGAGLFLACFLMYVSYNSRSFTVSRSPRNSSRVALNFFWANALCSTPCTIRHAEPSLVSG